MRNAYNRAEYLVERRRMMQIWADYLDDLAANSLGASLETELSQKEYPRESTSILVETARAKQIISEGSR